MCLLAHNVGVFSPLYLNRKLCLMNSNVHFDLLVPIIIGSLKKVTTLKIDENQLIYLPDSIGG